MPTLRKKLLSDKLPSNRPHLERSLAGKPSKQKLDLCTFGGALMAVLLLRLVLGLWALPVSAKFPDTPLERTVALWPPSVPRERWLRRIVAQPWLRYDAVYYVGTATRGPETRDGSASFHPLYPILAVPLIRAGLRVEWALFAVSTLATLSLCLLMAGYVARWHDPTANGATALLLAGPLGFILLAPYTEATFLVFAIGTLWAMRSEHWWLAGLLGGLSCLTRQQGLALAFPFLVLWFGAWRGKRAKLSDGAALFLMPLGYLAYSLYRVQVLGEAPSAAQLAHADPFHKILAWTRVLLVSPSSQQVVPGQGIAPPWRPFLESLHLLKLGALSYNHWIDFVFGWAGVLTVLCGWRQLNRGEKCYCFAIIILAACFDTQPYMGFPRHVFLAFPLFIIWAKWAARGGARRKRWSLHLAFIANLLLAGAYFRHGWVP